jgi:hypothetical protein
MIPKSRTEFSRCFLQIDVRDEGAQHHLLAAKSIFPCRFSPAFTAVQAR